MTSAEVRQSFLDFFRQRGHEIVPSAPVIPQDDPTLLFTNAGMNQFKDVFLCQGTRPYRRVADTQKCIRVSGKHNDLEEVGRDTYHHTFFEMLGNWSFGDYYKREAIGWAWELLTGVWGLPKRRLWATVHHTDEEASKLWREVTDIDPGHILRFGDKENFWEMGETGPCGPCSEIHIDLTAGGCDPEWVNAGRADVIELWNLVFIQYDRKADRVLAELPAKHVDTGMGMERVTAVLQSKPSNYDTDLFIPVLEAIAVITGRTYRDPYQVPMRVVADHLRALSFAIADGAIPSNEGRGYVLRRLLRRAARYGRQLGMEQPFLYQLVPTLAKVMGPSFPELVERGPHIQRVVHSEEESFGRTLSRGLELFEQVTGRLRGSSSRIFPGVEAFRLFDTFGFPADLTELMAREVGLEVEMKEFQALMEEQRRRSQLAGKLRLAEGETSEWQIIREGEHSLFTGYQSLRESARVCQVRRQGELFQVVLDRTPFYAESGGQVGDRGVLRFGDVQSAVLDTRKEGDGILHVVERLPDDLSCEVEALVEADLRLNTARHHTATHLLHAALHRVVGEHARQAGSLVAPDRLRFDFTHFEAVRPEELERIEAMVNEAVRGDLAVETEVTRYDEARAKGAMALFGEKYGDRVRMVTIGEFSRELCGGTHLRSTGQIGYFRIVSEGSVASGVRRIEALAGEASAALIRQEQRVLDDLRRVFPSTPIEKIPGQVQALLEDRKALERHLRKLQAEEAASGIGDLVQSAKELDGLKVVAARVEARDGEEMKSLGDALRAQLGRGVGVLGAVIGEKVSLIAVVTDDLVREKKLQAGRLVAEVAKMVGGGGGGRPHMALAGGKEADKLEEALAAVPRLVRNMLCS
ncbi:MAG: alanine--tRNA ligase [Planctomycetes bacterium]|nr:alanine--tRNA ligase [Planctomycetota bacterium]